MVSQSTIDAIKADMDRRRAERDDHETTLRMRQAYATALRHTHEGGRVEIHLGKDVVDYLKSLCEVPDPLAPAAGMIGATCWGHPVIPADLSDPGHISVHVVHDIF